VVKQLKNGATVLVDYSHLGVDRTVIANYSGQPGVERKRQTTPLLARDRRVKVQGSVLNGG